jgi:hypothetical protein
MFILWSCKFWVLRFSFGARDNLNIFLLGLGLFLSSIKFRFLVLSVDYLCFSNHDNFSRRCGLPIFWSNDWSCGSPTSCQNHVLCDYVVMFVSRKEMVTSMEEIFVMLKHMQQKKITFCEFVAHLQSIKTLTSLWCVLTTPFEAKESQIDLLNKFDVTCPNFKGFCNQVCVVIRLHLHQYPSGKSSHL